ncbi:hypothetical protein SPONN_2230 [uncultured Candidatus Thioglobus sp.]|nr:hypothetical protein SPONN_2230 [uncultured Candidatus Thioglobus sp.]
MYLEKIKSCNKVPHIDDISDEQKAEICAFIQGAIYYWCQINFDENSNESLNFTGRDLIGGKNRHWKGTPLLCLYKKYSTAGNSDKDSRKLAAIDAGHLLRWVVDNDKRGFCYVEGTSPRAYKWDGTPKDW